MKKSKTNKIQKSDTWLSDNGCTATLLIYVTALIQFGAFLAQIVQWFGLAVLAQAMLAANYKLVSVGNLFGVNNIPTAITIVVCGAILNALLTWLYKNMLLSTQKKALDYRVQKLLPILFPQQLSEKSVDPAETAADLMDRTKEIADYQVKSSSMRMYAVLAMLTIFGVTVMVHWPVAVLLFFATLVVPVNMWIAGKLAQEGQNKYLSELNIMSAKILDSFRGLDTLVRFNGTKRRQRVIEEASKNLSNTNYSILKRAFLSGMIMDVVVTFSIAIVATYVGFALMKYWGIPGLSISLSEGLFVLLLSPMYFTPFREMASAFHEKERAVAAAILLSKLPNMKTISDESSNTPLMDAPAIHLKDVAFKYEGVTPIFSDVELDIKAKERLAIIGPSGIGKTTLLNIIVGRFKTNSGQVIWETTEQNDLRPSVGQTAWLGQKFLLLEDTLRNNLRVAKEDASDAELLKALEIAQLTSWVRSLDRGLDTRLGNIGIMPSAGEKKRLSIARATLRGSKLWILDEPTAHLDDDNARVVMEAIKQATNDATVILVTHSSEALKIATRVFKLSKDGLSEVTDEKE